MSVAPLADRGGFALRDTARPNCLGRAAGVLAVFAVAAASGLGATFVAVENRAGLGAVRAGPWTAWPRNGAPDADPYSRAIVARSGELPLGLGEGLAFTARRDSAGRPLVSGCVYRIVGRAPQARAWTVTAETPQGGLIENAARRHGFTADEIVRDGAGRFAITLSRQARPGNWLPLGPEPRFQVVLRLYDSPVSAAAAALDAAFLPVIEREDCA